MSPMGILTLGRLCWSSAWSSGITSLMKRRNAVSEYTSSGVNVPLDVAMLADLIAELPRPLCGKELPTIIDDRRFAETIYRVAIASGAMERMKHEDPPDGMW